MRDRMFARAEFGKGIDPMRPTIELRQKPLAHAAQRWREALRKERYLSQRQPNQVGKVGGVDDERGRNEIGWIGQIGEGRMQGAVFRLLHFDDEQLRWSCL